MIIIAKGTKYKYEDYHRINDNGELEKKCTLHNEFFPTESEWIPCTTEYFYKNNKNIQDGLHPQCKLCSRIKALQYRAENYEEQLQKILEYDKTNRDKRKKRMVTYYQNNKDIVR